MTQALKLVTVAHWSQSGELSAQHIRGEGSNVMEHTNNDELLLKIIDRFSFQGNMVINMTRDAIYGKSINEFSVYIVVKMLLYSTIDVVMWNISM